MSDSILSTYAAELMKDAASFNKLDIQNTVFGSQYQEDMQRVLKVITPQSDEDVETSDIEEHRKIRHANCSQCAGGHLIYDGLWYNLEKGDDVRRMYRHRCDKCGYTTMLSAQFPQNFRNRQ